MDRQRLRGRLYRRPYVLAVAIPVLSYILRRLTLTAVLLFAIAATGFLALSLLPGDPVRYLFPDTGDPSQYDELKARFGLDRPLVERLAVYMRELVHGNLGHSLSQARPVSEAIAERVPATLLLATGALIVALGGIPLGVLLAHLAQRKRRTERSGFLLLLISTGMPPFLLGLLLILVFSIWLGLLPSQGMTSVRSSVMSAARLQDVLPHLLLPALTLGVQPMAGLARVTRARILDILHQDYIRTARAKGLSERAVLLRHALKNALPTPITLLALAGGHWIGGAIVTETVFAWPGLGRLAVEAVLARDYPLILGILVLSAAVIVFANLTADLLASWLDPRVRHG